LADLPAHSAPITYGLCVNSSCTGGVRRLRLSALLLVALAAPVAVGLGAQPGSAAPATVDRAPAQRYLTATVNKKEVKKGRQVTISGLVDAPGAPVCSAGVTLDVERNTRGAVYKVVDTVTTDTSGVYRVKEVVKKKSRFRISVPATDACVTAQSPPRTVRLKEG
jgi:hypothetical protein